MAETQRPSEMSDYYNVLNPLGIQTQNPSLRYNIVQDSANQLDVQAPEFKAVFDTADIETQREMLKGTSVSHSLKIAERRKVFADSEKAVNQDPFVMQMAMGAIPALLSPTTAIPVAGVAAKALQVGKAASRLANIAKVGAVGAISGGVAAAGDEALFDAQGVQHNYLSATMMGVALGGGLGALSGALVGPAKHQVAETIVADADTWTKDFDVDPQLHIDSTDGTPRIVGVKDVGQMRKSWLDQVPMLGKWLRSDVNTVYQSPSKALRDEMSKLSPATVSLKDTDGNLLPIRTTAADFKRERLGVYQKNINDVSNLHMEAKKAGYTGTRDDFVAEIMDTYNRAARDQEMRAYKSDVPHQEYYEGVEAKFTHENPLVVKGAESYRAYFQDMLAVGKDLGIKELGKLGTGKIYRPRIWNFRDIHNGKIPAEEVRQRIYNGLANHPNQAGLTADQLEEATTDIINNLGETTFDLNFATNSYIAPTKLPFATMLKAKTWKLDEVELGNLLNQNFDDITGAYHYKMSGRQAVHFAFGTDDVKEIMAGVSKEMIDEGNTLAKDELIAFENIIKDLSGALRMNALADTSAWTWTRNLASFNSARLGGGFGGNQFVELASNILMNGVSNMVSGRFANSWKSAGKLLYTKQKVDDEFTNALINSGYMGDALHTSRINRYSDQEAGFNSAILENSLNGINDKLMKWNGMRYFMGVMEDMTGGAIMEQMKNIGSKAKPSASEMRRLTRWGLDHEDAKALAEDIGKHYDPKAGKFDLDAFTPSNQEKFQLAISRGIDETVIQGDSLHLPNWMKAPNPIFKLMTQFMRFPMIANEVLLRKGLQEEQARMVSSVIASAATYMGMKYVREQAAIQAGFVDEVDAKYDYFGYNGEEAINRGLLESFNYNAPLGMMSTIFNEGAVATGNPELGRDYTTNNQMEAFMGPTFGGLGQDVLEITKAAASGELLDERTVNKAKGFVPFQNLPLINEGLRYLIKEEF